MEEKNYWGYHLIVDAAGCDKQKIADYDNIYAFTKQLVKDIDMVAYGEPQIVDFGTGNKAGYSLVQLIETSNICAHFVNEYGDVYLDVFSCKNFDPEVVEGLVYKYFGAKTIGSKFLNRQA